MASVISHAAAGAALSIAFGPDDPPVRYWPIAIVIAVLPDLDSFLSYFRYDPTLGHRGFFHSPFLGLIISFFVDVFFLPGPDTLFCSLVSQFFLFFLVWLSHGLLDALTNGGSGVAFLCPFSSARYFLPWTPIQVSPMRIKSFFSPRGCLVLKSEFVWIWLPGFALVFLSRMVRLRMQELKG